MGAVQSLSASQTVRSALVHDALHTVPVVPERNAYPPTLPHAGCHPSVPVAQQTFPAEELAQSIASRHSHETSPVAQLPTAPQVDVPVPGSQQVWPAAHFPALPPLPMVLKGQYTPADDSV